QRDLAELEDRQAVDRERMLVGLGAQADQRGVDDMEDQEHQYPDASDPVEQPGPGASLAARDGQEVFKQATHLRGSRPARTSGARAPSLLCPAQASAGFQAYSGRGEATAVQLYLNLERHIFLHPRDRSAIMPRGPAARLALPTEPDSAPNGTRLTW